MQNFYYFIPTEVYFGKGQISHLGEALKQFGSRVLLVYGGGSVKKFGVYDAVMEEIKKAGLSVTELSGVEPNPRVTTVNKGATICKEQQIDVVLPVGGGSTIDCAKGIAAGAKYDGDAWDLVMNSSLITDALPIVAVLTVAATGSEMDEFGVISNMETNDKKGLASPLVKPKVSIMDPEYTYSVPKYHTAAGTADIMSHLFELYFKEVEDGAYMQKRMIEALLKTCIKYGPIACEKPDNYEARSNLMWASSWAINGFLKAGFAGAWSCHPMEHQLSAYYDVTHGVGLAILTPHWMRHILSDRTVDLFVEYGVNVWGIDKDLDKFDIANLAIDKTKELFDSMNIPKTFREIGITEKDKFEVMAEKTVAAGITNCYAPLTKEDVLEIFDAAF